MYYFVTRKMISDGVSLLQYCKVLLFPVISTRISQDHLHVSSHSKDGHDYLKHSKQCHGVQCFVGGGVWGGGEGEIP